MKRPFKVYFLMFLLSLLTHLYLACSVLKAALDPNVYEQIKKDFTPISGLIIGIDEKEIIIDKGSAQGVKPKDIFAVYKRGKKIVHPETQKTLGFTKELIGKIEITRVEENFAVGKALMQREPFPVPTPITRFSDLKVLIISENPNITENLFLLLKTNLSESVVIFNPTLRFSQLNPQYLLSEKVDLLFVEEETGIKVFDGRLELLRYYGSFSLKKPIITSSKPLSQPSIAERYTEAKPTSLQPSLLGKTKAEVIQAEFSDLDGDNVPELIYFNSQGLFIVKIREGLLASYKPDVGQIVNFSLGHEGWIALNVYDERVGMRSEVLRHTSQGLVSIIKNVNLILNFVDYVGRGVKDTLLGQTFDPDSFFGKEVYILKREDNQLVYAKKLDLFEDYQNIGTIFVDLDQDGTPEILAYLPEGRIGIYKDKKLVWKTPYPVVNHFYQIRLVKGKKGQEIVKKILYPLVSPVVIHKDRTYEVLFVSVDFPLDRVKKDLKHIPLNSATSQVFSLRFEEGTYFYRNLGNAQVGFITGLGWLSNYLYYVLVKGKYPGEVESELYYSFY